jgi:TP901 family phage tail tape measure protein
VSASRNINVLLTGNATQLRGVLMAASRDVDSFNKKVTTSGSAGSRSMQIWGTAAKAGGLLAAAGFAYAIAKATEFDRLMRNVNSITKLSEEGFNQLSDSVREMSLALPQTANELAEGMYEISSSGFQGAEGLTVLEASAVAASAGLTDTMTSSKAIVAVLNAYGMSASEAARVGDVLFAGVDVGVMRFEELANQLGDYVGIAAAANISIEETTAALAAMTLAGINTAESSTSLNRLITDLLDPSETLGATFTEWGYASGEAALGALGLRGVMEKLRETTGGNVTALLELFPEVRAARGAFALMAADGENYARTSERIARADEGQGAMREALEEQMKALSYQWQIFVNWLNSGAISIGSAALPALLSLLDGLKSLGEGIGNMVSTASEALAPFVDDMVSGFEDLWEAAQDVWEAIAPTAELLLTMAGGAILGVLTALGKTFSFAADMANRFDGVVMAVVVTLGVMKAASAGGAGLTALAALWQRAAYQAAFAKLMFTEAAAAAGASGAGGAGKFFAGLGGLTGLTPITAAVAAFTVAVVGVGRAMANEEGKAKTWAKEFREALNIDPNSLWSVKEAVAATGDEIDRLRELAGSDNGFNALRELSQLANPWESNGITESRKRLEELEEQQAKNVRREEVLRHNTKLLADAFGMTANEAANFADRNKIDLGGSFMTVETMLLKADEALEKHGERLGRNSQEMKAFSDLAVEEMEAAAKAETDFLDEVAKGLTKSQDVIAQFGKDGTGGFKNLRLWYDTAIEDTQEFGDNISKAIQMGVDPNFVKRALTAGPAEAGALLEDIVSDSTGRMMELVNGAEAALSAANSRLIEMARITHRATTSDSQTVAMDAAKAMEISLLTMEEGANTSSESIASAVGLSISEVERIADEYGIVVNRVNGQVVDPKIDAKKAKEFREELERINTNIREWSDADPRIDVAANISDPAEKFATLRDIALEYVNSNPTTQAYFESLDAQGKMQYLVSLIGDGSLWTAYMNLDTSQLSEASTRVFQTLTSIVATDPTAIAYLETASADEQVEFIKGELMEYAALHPEAQADVATAIAELDFETLTGWARAWGRRTDTANARVQVSGQAEAEGILGRLTRERIATIRVVTSNDGAAQRAATRRATVGSRWGNVFAFAKGGVTPAHIARGTRYKYAEPETGGEGFVPKNGRPERSIPIIRTLADWYGLDVVKRAKYTAARNGLVNGPTRYQPISRDVAVGGGPATFKTDVTIVGNVYGVEDLQRAIDDGVSKSITKNYGRFTGAVRAGEDARR